MWSDLSRTSSSPFTLLRILSMSLSLLGHEVLGEGEMGLPCLRALFTVSRVPRAGS